MTPDQATELRTLRENLAALARWVAAAGRAETAEEANYRHRVEGRIAVLTSGKENAE